MNKIIMSLIVMSLTGGAYAAEFEDLAVSASHIKSAIAVESNSGSKGYVIANDPVPGAPVIDVEWVAIPGGKFIMGTDNASEIFADAKPIHEVSLKTFEMSKTLVTVEQFNECVIQGKCDKPGKGGYCNWGKTGRHKYPVNCVDWHQASAYAKFKGGRLPSESEWEYAATSGGKNIQYPWGNEPASCFKTVMNDADRGGIGCGASGTMPVCSRPEGNTEQGLCDMTGNLSQWVQDRYQASYKGAPGDGGAYEGEGNLRVVRGGPFDEVRVNSMRSDVRHGGFGGLVERYEIIGFRIAK